MTYLDKKKKNISNCKKQEILSKAAYELQEIVQIFMTFDSIECATISNGTQNTQQNTFI